MRSDQSRIVVAVSSVCIAWVLLSAAAAWGDGAPDPLDDEIAGHFDTHVLLWNADWASFNGKTSSLTWDESSDTRVDPPVDAVLVDDAGDVLRLRLETHGVRYLVYVRRDSLRTVPTTRVTASLAAGSAPLEGLVLSGGANIELELADARATRKFVWRGEGVELTGWLPAESLGVAFERDDNPTREVQVDLEPAAPVIVILEAPGGNVVAKVTHDETQGYFRSVSPDDLEGHVELEYIEERLQVRGFVDATTIERIEPETWGWGGLGMHGSSGAKIEVAAGTVLYDSAHGGRPVAKVLETRDLEAGPTKAGWTKVGFWTPWSELQAWMPPVK